MVLPRGGRVFFFAVLHGPAAGNAWEPGGRHPDVSRATRGGLLRCHYKDEKEVGGLHFRRRTSAPGPGGKARSPVRATGRRKAPAAADRLSAPFPKYGTVSVPLPGARGVTCRRYLPVPRRENAVPGGVGRRGGGARPSRAPFPADPGIRRSTGTPPLAGASPSATLATFARSLPLRSPKRPPPVAGYLCLAPQAASGEPPASLPGPRLPV
jgi:hypothetical protein